MEIGQDSMLAKMLDVVEVETIKPEIRKKLERFYESKLSEFYTAKAISETAQKNIDTIRNEATGQVTELSTRVQDLEAKVDKSDQNCAELRQQLDTSRQEVIKLQDHVSRYESEVSECRRVKKVAEEERDSLAKLAERRSIEVDRLQADMNTLEKQLQAASRAKCEALARVHEIESKEVTLEFKEKRLDQEKQILTHQIQTLSEDLNRNISELQTIRRENTMSKIRLETALAEKVEELRITRSSVSHLEEANAALRNNAEELTTKLHGQNDETAKVLNHYKKELQSKTKLVEMMKEAKQENDQQINEMATCITELKKLLNESTERYGELETRLKGIDMEHGKDLEEKNVEIQRLKDELVHANDLLKTAQEESLEQAVTQLAPTAAATSRLIKSGTSLTEIYSLYVKASEEVQSLRKENSQLDLRIRSIIEEVEERAPQMCKQALDNQKLEEINVELSNQLETMIRERVDAKAEYDDMVTKLGHMEREYKKLKISQSDLGLQVCYLIKEIEQMRGGFTSDMDQSISSDMSASEVISKKLVTFANIQELQENNQKLLHVVRDLSAKLEEIEECEAQADAASFEAKLATYTKRMEQMQRELVEKDKLVELFQQRERNHKLYLKTSAFNRSFNSQNGSFNAKDDSLVMDDDEMSSNVPSSAHREALAAKDRRISELEERLKETQEQIKSLKEEQTQARKEFFANEKKLNEQFDTMRTEIRELTASNCKLMTTVEYNNEQLKLQQKNAATYKHQINTLEEKNKCYEKIIVKHEHTETVLRDEMMKVQSQLGRAEVQLANIKHENKMMHETEARVRIEIESLHRERLNQNLLMNNLDMIKASFERSESEGKIRLEERLDEANRECSALRRRLQEEQDHFRLLAADLERQTATAKNIMEEEVAQVNKVRDELKLAREEIHAKSLQIENLSVKLQESLTPSKSDNPIALAQKRVKELELRAGEYVIEVESLQKELLSAKEHAQQYCKLSESAEAELKAMSATFTEYKERMEADLTQTKANEETLKARVEDLETELSLQITKEQITDGDASTQLNRTRTELRDTLQKLSESHRELREAREQVKTLTASLQAVEQKYSNEMMAHLKDLDSMASNKDELNRMRDSTQTLKDERDRAVESLRVIRTDWEAAEHRLRTEVEQLESRLNDHQVQNATLLDQIQSLTIKLSMSATANGGNATDMNISASAMDTSFSNRSLTEDDVKSADQLLQIIKYLRKEKDIAFAKVDVLKSETTRLQSEQAIMQKRVEEAQATLNAERTKPEADIVSAAKHEEVLRKVETLNAIADSNRVLREERNQLTNSCKDLTERIKAMEEQLYPVQEKNRELQQKQEEMTTENVTLRTEVTRWRQRANALVEAKNKTNPEDFKRLQNEREGLAKMLTAEKEVTRKAQEELNAVRVEKQKLDAVLATLEQQVHSMDEDGKKMAVDMQTLRSTNQRLTNELMEVKNNLLQREERVRQIEEEMTQKEALLNDTRNKENQIRKIAKRYKDSYMELKNKDMAGEGGAGGTGAAASQPSTVELNEENEQLRREIETLKTVEQQKVMEVDQVKARVMALEQAQNTLTDELTASRSQQEQVREEASQRVSRLEKELSDERENKETIARLMRENESLSMRVAQLQRQLGIQQAAKPSTSGASTTEKATGECPRTANVKPMSSPSHQSATVTPWRASETPLASIRPMTQNRTAAVIPTSQMPPGGSNMMAVQGTSSSTTPSTSLTPSVTALVPPQQQVHTTGSNSSSEAMSSSPTSSHTDYMPATSSATIVVAAVPPMGSSSSSTSNAESTQHDSDNGGGAGPSAGPGFSGQQMKIAQPTTIGGQPQQQQMDAAKVVMVQSQAGPSTQQVASQQQQQQQLLGQPLAVIGQIQVGQQLQQQQQQQQQQAVALVSPRLETTNSNQQPQQNSGPMGGQEQAPSTSGAAASGMQQSQQMQSSHHHHQASSSSAVTTSQAGGHKRQRDVEGDSSTGGPQEGSAEKAQPQMKRIRVGQTTTTSSNNDGFQGVSGSGIDVEYQVPTSSQRESDYDIIVVDSEDDDDDDEEEDDGMVDEGTAEADDGPFEDEADNGESYEMDMGYGQEQGILMAGHHYDEADVGPDIDEDNNLPSDNNEVEVDDSNEIPNQSGNNSNSGGDPEHRSSQSRSSDQAVDMSTQHQQDVQQIQATSSGGSINEAGSSTTNNQTSSSIGTTQGIWRANPTHSRQSTSGNASQLVLIQPGYEETGDDCIVPSTPNLLATRRADGVVNSPHPQVPHASRFTFNESLGSGAPVRSLVPGGNMEAIEDTQIDLSQLNDQGSSATGRSVPNTPKLIPSPRSEVDTASGVAGPSRVSATSGAESSNQQQPQQQPPHQQHEAEDLVIHHHEPSDAEESKPGPSRVDDTVAELPQITVTDAAAADEVEEEPDDIDVDEEEQESDGPEQNATTSHQSEEQEPRNPPPSDTEEGADGVSSEGEKPAASGTESGLEMEEGREAEASQSPTINTRSRASSAQSSPPVNRRGGRGMRGRTPIVWNDNGRGGGGGPRGGMMTNTRAQQQHQQNLMMQQQAFQQQQQMQQLQQQQMMPQRGQRGRRMRGRTMGPNFHPRYQ